MCPNEKYQPRSALQRALLNSLLIYCSRYDAKEKEKNQPMSQTPFPTSMIINKMK